VVSVAITTLAEPTTPTAATIARGTIVLTGQDGSVGCERCVVADRMFSRMKGLLGRRSLPAGEGLLIRPAPSIHTFFMRFPIDVVFLSRAGEVMKISADVRPWRIRSCRHAYAVLELAAGEAEKRGITTRDHLTAEARASK
jgi:uncharacterized membrane protein (UPF0127 family)